MGQNPVIAERDAYAAGEVIEKEPYQHGLPGEELRQEGGEGSEVDGSEGDACGPFGRRLRANHVGSKFRLDHFLGHQARVPRSCEFGVSDLTRPKDVRRCLLDVSSGTSATCTRGICKRLAYFAVMKRPPAMQSRGVSPFAAILLFFAFTAPLGIAAHLISELAGLGWHDDADVAFSARHGYLALIAVAALAALALSLRAVPRGDRRERIAQIVDALPFKGHGARFVALSFGLQFAFFAVTQIGEGCPLCSGDVFTGVLAAALAALCGAFAILLGSAACSISCSP